MSETKSKLRIISFEQSKHSSMLDELTDLLHRAYHPLALKGMKYLATHQSSDVTKSRLLKGDGFLAFLNKELVGTITIVKDDPSEPCDWYQSKDVYFITQYAIHPQYQGMGLGRQLLDFAEEYSKDQGARELALDTSEHADELIRMYSERKYRFIEYANWDVTNYRSVVLSKSLEV